MVHATFFFILLSNAAISLIQTDEEAELAAMVKEITRLEAFIRENPKDRNIDMRKAELADAKFKAGRLLCRKKNAGQDPEVQDIVEREAGRYFEDAVKLYGALAIQFEKAGRAVPSKKRKKTGADRKFRDSGCMRLKAGICCYFWKDLFPERTRGWYGRLEDADLNLNRSLGVIPMDDPVNMWAWLYIYLISSHRKQENACKALHYSVMNLGRTGTDLKKTLFRKSDKAWLILDLRGSRQHLLREEAGRGSLAWPLPAPPSGRDGALSGRAGAPRDLPQPGRRSHRAGVARLRGTGFPQVPEMRNPRPRVGCHRLSTPFQRSHRRPLSSAVTIRCRVKPSRSCQPARPMSWCGLPMAPR